MSLEIFYQLGDVMGLSLKAEQLGITHMAARAVYAYVLLIAVARLGHQRLLDRTTPFDIILGILLGSIGSRAITGNAPFYPSLGACAVLVLMHGVLAAAAFRSKLFAFLVKGTAALLIRDGVPQQEALRKTDVADHDIDEALRLHGMTEREQVALAHIERNGQISIVKTPRQTKILEVAVADGVQTVRLEVA